MEAAGMRRIDERERMLREVEQDFAATAAATGLPQMGDRVREALRHVPRDAFVPPELAEAAYDNRPLPIGHGQTISQPFIVALMTELAAVQPDDAVLEVGTGCGYQTAVLARLARVVHSIEIVDALAAQARERLGALGVANVELHVGDGHLGWPAAAPYDAIVVTAAPPQLPPALVEQLEIGGRLVLPLGPLHEAQELWLVHKQADGTTARSRRLAVQFVPMTGGATAAGASGSASGTAASSRCTTRR
jgi:protein-L-isoaspartate(D-aspartate) O-methyltransferase